MSKLGFSRLSSGDSGFELRASFVIRHSSFVISNVSAVNETLIHDVVAEVMERLNGSFAPVKAAPAPATPPPSSRSCGCDHTKKKKTACGSCGARKFRFFSRPQRRRRGGERFFFETKEKGRPPPPQGRG